MRELAGNVILKVQEVTRGQAQRPPLQLRCQSDAGRANRTAGEGSYHRRQALHGNFWPEDEPNEDFLAALHEWRGHKKADPAA